jgi:diguanylate cyclase (GGDEF)-like protein
MELRAFVHIMLRRWWIIASFFVVTVTVAAVVTFTQTPVYRTSATYVVSPSSEIEDLKNFVAGLDTLSRREGVSATYTEIFISRTIFQAATEKLGLTPQQVQNISITSKVIPTTNVIKVEVEGDNPTIIKAVSDAVGDETIAYIKNLYEVYTLKKLDMARSPKWPALPNKPQNLGLAAVLGLTLGGALAFLVDYLRGAPEAMTGLTIIHSGTGAYNRQYFLQRLGEEISRAKRSEKTFSLAIMHIERLDMLEDTPFSKARSEALRQVTVFLKQNLREEDLIAYFRESHYAFLLPDTAGPAAKRFIEKLQRRIEWTVFELAESGLKLNLTSTCGLVTLGPDTMNREELLAKAEQALQFAGVNGHSNPYLLDEPSAQAA